MATADAPAHLPKELFEITGPSSTLDVPLNIGCVHLISLKGTSPKIKNNQEKLGFPPSCYKKQIPKDSEAEAQDQLQNG